MTQTMHICIDGMLKKQNDKVGVERLSDTLLEQLFCIGGDNLYSVVKYYKPLQRCCKNIKGDSIKCLHIPTKVWLLITIMSHMINFPVDKFMNLTEVDIYLFMQQMFPKLNTPSIMIVYDMIPFLYPQFLTITNKYYNRIMLPRLIQQATAIIAISKSTKEDIVRIVHIDDKKIHVVYPGLSGNFKIVKDDAKINDVRSRYNTGNNYILFVATLEPRKNAAGLIKAFNIFCKNGDEKHKLIIVGRKGWKYKEIFHLVAMLDDLIKERIVFAGRVPDNDLVYLYNGASVFVYPSFYEGFGFPPLEAMACGVPVVVSKIPSLVEICGDAAFYINPHSIDNIAEGISSVITNNILKCEMVQKGIKRISMFKWENTAREVLNILGKIMEKR